MVVIIKMIDIKSKIISLKLSWAKRAITHPNTAWKLLVGEIIKHIYLDNLIKGKHNGKNFIDKLPNFYKNNIFA